MIVFMAVLFPVPGRRKARASKLFLHIHTDGSTKVLDSNSLARDCAAPLPMYYFLKVKFQGSTYTKTK